MSTTPVTGIRLPVPRTSHAVAATGVSILLLLAVGMAGALQRGGPSIALAIAGGLALAGVLALAVSRYDVAVAVGFLLSGVVFVEPAPPDGVFAVVIAVALVTGRFDIRRVPMIVTGLVGALISLNVLSATELVSGSTAMRFFGITLYMAVFSLWFAQYLDSPRRARMVVVAYLAIAIVSAALGVLAVNFPIPLRAHFLGDAVRAKGMFKDPNVFGPFLIPIAMIVLEERLAPRLLRMRPLVNGAVFALLSLGVLFSYSRAAWINYVIALFVTLLVIGLRRGGGGRALRILASVLVVGALAGAAVTVSGSLSFLESRAHSQSYDTHRFSAQREGIHLAEQYPVGVGPGQFQYYSPLATHSTYIRILVEQGILGLVVWLALALTTLILALRNVLVGADTYGIGSAALLGSWCGLLVNSGVVDTLHWRHLWLVAPLIWAGAMRSRGTRALPAGARPASRRARPARAPAS